MEVNLLIGDATKANTKLGWTPKYALKDLVKEMVASDLDLIKRYQLLQKGDHRILNYFE